MIKKKLLIIKPPYKSFSIGFAYVLACLDKHRISFDFVDAALPFLDYRKNLRKNDYLAVASGGLIGHFRFFNEIVKNTRKIRPDLPIILGGNITKDIKYEFLFDKIGIDFGIVGEAETSLPYLLNVIDRGQDDLRNIPGILYKNKTSGEVFRNIPQRLNLENENIMPAWQYFDLDHYFVDVGIPFCGRHSFMPVLTGRGCVGRCSFCSPTIGSFRMRPIKYVMEEIGLLNERYDFEWILISNEMAYQTKGQVLAFCEAYKNLKIRKPWYGSFRTDSNFDKETFAAMKDAGCISISIGIESGSDRILGLMKKDTTSENTKRFFRIANEIGLPCSGSFMVGNEGETEKEIRESVDMVLNEGMTSGTSFTSSYPGTLIYKQALKRGLITDEWEYLKNFKFASDVWDWGWIDRSSYVNITDIPNENFWNTIVNELRRFHTSLFNKYEAKNTKFRFLFNALCIEAKGLCSYCGQKTVSHLPFTFLEMEAYCPRCFRQVYFNIYKCKKFIKHFNLLRKELNNADNLVISGTNSEASAFLRLDRFTVDYSKIKGFLEVMPRTVWNNMFINKPRIKFDDLTGIKPDIILVVGDNIGHSASLIKQFYFKKGLKAPKILHLFPRSKLWDFILKYFINIIGYGFSFEIKLTKLLYVLEKMIIKVMAIFIDIVKTKPKRMIGKRVIYGLRYFYLLLSNLWEKGENSENPKSIRELLFSYVYRYKEVLK